MGFSEKQFYAAAQWWADRLPGRGEKSPQEIDSVGNLRKEADRIVKSVRAEFSLSGAASYSKAAVTDDQYQIFIENIVAMLRVSAPQEALDGRSFLALETDYGPMSSALVYACSLANINGDDLPFKTSVYLQDDGQIMVPLGGRKYAPLDYEGRPEGLYIDTDDVDFSGCPYFMKDKRYLVAELEPGQAFTSVIKRISGKEYYSETAKEGQAVVVCEDATPKFWTLKKKDIFNAQAHPSISFSSVWNQSEVADGAGERYGQGGRVERLDDEGHIRILSLPFRAKKITGAASSGYGSHYAVLEPGDFLIQTAHEHYASIDSVRKEELENGTVRWVPSTKDGKVVEGDAISSRHPHPQEL